MWTILEQTVHDIAQFSDMIDRFNSVIADMKTNIIYFGQLLSSAKQDELCLVTVQLEKFWVIQMLISLIHFSVLAMQSLLEFGILGLNDR